MNIAKLFVKRFLTPVCGGLLLLCTGCDPKEWICWAPDGQHAFVQGADDTWLVDSSGTILGKATDARAWLPDSRRVIAIRTVKPGNWDEYAQLLGPERAEKATKAAARLLEMIQNYQGDWSKFGESEPYKKWDHTEIGETYNGGWLVRSAALYLKQTNPQAIAPIFKTIPENDIIPDVYEIIVRGVLPPEPLADQLLARFPDDVRWVCASPAGQVVAFTVEEPQRPALYVVSQAAGSQAVLVDEGVTEADWSTDGQCLVYAKTTVPYHLLQKSVQLGTITRRHICGPDGQLLAAFESAQDLAGVILGQNSTTRVACLPDGRILFAAAPVRLPAVTTDLPSQLTLFALRPGATPTLESVVRPEAILPVPNRIDRFSVSPDRKKVAFLTGRGQVSVVSLDTGEVVSLQDASVYPDKGEYTQLIPNWRNANEVTCVVPVADRSGSSGRAEVVLVNLNGQKTAISKSWPSTMTKKLLPPND